MRQICCVLYISAGGVHDEMMFGCSLWTNITDEAIFDSWLHCEEQHWLVKMCWHLDDHWKTSGLAARVCTVAPSTKATRCSIHREQLAVIEMPRCLQTALFKSVKILNLMKSKSLSTELYYFFPTKLANCCVGLFPSVFLNCKMRHTWLMFQHSQILHLCWMLNVWIWIWIWINTQNMKHRICIIQTLINMNLQIVCKYF